MTGINKVLEERRNRYGTFMHNARISQQLKRVVKGSGSNYHLLKADQQEAIDMICSKLSRMLTGDPQYEDNLVDIIGYTQLVLDRIRDEKTKEA
jgi:hypothetical protein